MISPFDLPIKGAPFAVIDCESTGYAGPDTHVVEIAIVHGMFGSDDVRLVYSSRVRPPVSIPEAASKVHGIYDRDVTDAPTWADIADTVAAAIGDRVVIAYNAPADYLFVATEQDRLGRPHLPKPWQEQRWLDLLVVRKATKTRGRPGKLLEVAAEYGIALDAHGAAGDALATALLVRPMMRAAWTVGAFTAPWGAQPKRWDDEEEDEEPVNPTSLRDLLDWQRSAAIYQERDFAAYIQRQGGTPPQSYHHVLEGLEPPTWDTGPKPAACPSCAAPTLRKIGQDGGLVRVNADGTAHACPQ